MIKKIWHQNLTTHPFFRKFVASKNNKHRFFCHNIIHFVKNHSSFASNEEMVNIAFISIFGIKNEMERKDQLRLYFENYIPFKYWIVDLNSSLSIIRKFVSALIGSHSWADLTKHTDEHLNDSLSLWIDFATLWHISINSLEELLKFMIPVLYRYLWKTHHITESKASWATKCFYESYQNIFQYSIFLK